MAVCMEQLGCVADAIDAAAWENIVVAYEPVWAIGTGKTATAEQVGRVPPMMGLLGVSSA
mgnify:CR=1 FL=1